VEPETPRTDVPEEAAGGAASAGDRAPEAAEPGGPAPAGGAADAGERPAGAQPAAAGADQAPAGEQSAAAEAEGAPAGQASSADVVEHDLEELRAKAAERDEFLALAQRTQADFENFRKRTQREMAQAEQRGIARVVKELLPALDNLDRALAAAEAHVGEDSPEHRLAEGIRLVHSELMAAIGRVGVEGYSPKGERFDPTVHEAMAQQPVEGAESGTVVEVYQQGYRIGDTLIRPARVVVAA
jgi:molecular chaperone GrpE